MSHSGKQIGLPQLLRQRARSSSHRQQRAGEVQVEVVYPVPLALQFLAWVLLGQMPVPGMQPHVLVSMRQ